MPSAVPQVHTYHCICASLLLSTTHKLSSLPRRTTSTGGLDAALILPLPASPPALESDTYNTIGAESRGQGQGYEEDEEADEEAAQEEQTDRDGAAQHQQPQPQSQDITPLPPQGYTILLGLDADRKVTLIRREDGFEKRLLHRCSRCRLVVGYTLLNASGEEDGDGAGTGTGTRTAQEHPHLHGSDAMDVDADVKSHEKGKGRGNAGQESGKEIGKEKETYRGKVIYLLPGGIMSTEVMAKGGDLGGGRRIGEEDVGIKGAEGRGVFE